MNQLPKISIVTPSFNQAVYLEETLRSLTEQGYPELELIVIDGGSSDASVDIIRKYEHHLAYWCSEPDGGQSEAINKGLRKVSGDVVTWINSDDLLMPGALHTVGRFFAQAPAHCAVLHGKSVLFGEQMQDISKGAPENTDLSLHYLAGLPFPQPSSFFRSEVLATCGYIDERLHFGMDYDFFLRMALKYQFAATPEVLSKYRLHPNSKSTTSNVRFGVEYGKIFSRLLNSHPDTMPLRDIASDAGIYHADASPYEGFAIPDTHVLAQALPIHLKYCLTFFYQGHALDRCYRLVKTLRKYYPDVYSADAEWRGLYWRSLPALRPLISLLKILNK